MAHRTRDFLKILTGVALLATPLSSALAGPAPRPTVERRVKAAANLAEKLADAATAPTSYNFNRTGPQPFGEVVGPYFQSAPFGRVFIQSNPGLRSGDEVAMKNALRPSKAFDLVRKA